MPQGSIAPDATLKPALVPALAPARTSLVPNSQRPRGRPCAEFPCRTRVPGESAPWCLERVNARRASGLFKQRAEMFTSAAGEVLQNRHQEISRTMTGFRNKAKEKIDDAADVTQKAADQVIDKSRDVAHHMGKKMEEAGKRLQNA